MQFRKSHLNKNENKNMTIPPPGNLISRSPLWRRVLLVTVPAAALVALAVAFQPVARADTTSSPTPTPTPPKFKLLRTVPLQSNAWGAVTVNLGLNKIYTSGNPGDTTNTNEEVTVIDGRTFATTDVGYGTQVSVDNKTNRYWAATIYQGSVIVRDGTTNSEVARVNLGFCPIQTIYDFFKNRVWVGAQCGAGDDPVFAIDAARLQEINPPGAIHSAGIFGSLIANGANGRVYVNDPTEGISERINPTTFAVTNNPFPGTVMAINARTNKLYTIDSGNNLQIINGAPDPEVILATVALGYTPGSMGINTAFNYLYIANPAGRSIQVRNGSTGALITTFNLPTGARPSGPIAVDSIRSRIYVIRYPSGNSAPALLVIEDLINAEKPYCVLSH
jgi:hypothetical protein